MLGKWRCRIYGNDIPMTISTCGLHHKKRPGLTLAGYPGTRGRTAQRYRIESYITGKKSVKWFLMLFCCTNRSMLSPMPNYYERGAIQSLMGTDAETHSQTLGRDRGTPQKKGRKDHRSQRSWGYYDNMIHRINKEGLIGAQRNWSDKHGLCMGLC